MQRLATSAWERERAVVEEARLHYEQQPLRRKRTQPPEPKQAVAVRARPTSKAQREERRIRREWELMEIARWERRVASTAERRKLWKNAAHGCATHEELDQLFPSRYGRV